MAELQLQTRSLIHKSRRQHLTGCLAPLMADSQLELLHYQLTARCCKQSFDVTIAYNTESRSVARKLFSTLQTEV